MAGKFVVGDCEACRRSGERVEKVLIDGNEVNLCVNLKACRNATNVAELFRDTDRLLGRTR